ncbi:MAG: hypothetical protein AB3N18_18945 [Allomuricauda sp.]
MKQIYFLLALFFSVCSMHAQENYVDLVQVGDQLTLGEPSGASYTHVLVPRKNFIIKRGAIPNVNALEDTKVTITDITYGKTPQITFKKSDGSKFFRFYKTMKANFNQAVATGELKIPSNGGKGAVVR